MLDPSYQGQQPTISDIPEVRYLLVVDSQFETSWTPIDELDCPAHLDGGDSLVSIPRDDISTVQKRTSHVMSGTRIADDHLIVGLETLECDVLNTMTFVLGLGFGDDGCAGDEGVVNTGVRNQVSLELGKINIQGSFETEGCSD